MSLVEPIPSYLVFAPPRNLPLGLKDGQGIFGTARDRPGNRYYSYHHGVDLYEKDASDDGSVYSVAWGFIDNIASKNYTSGSNTYTEYTVTVRHRPPTAGFFTIYRHLGSHAVSTGDEVSPVTRIGDIQELRPAPHLHFEFHRLVDPTENIKVPNAAGKLRMNYITLDPTRLLYHSEVHHWPDGVDRFAHNEYMKINRLRIAPWPGGKRPATWLFQVNMPNPNDSNDSNGEMFYLPLENQLPHQESLVALIRDAFQTGARIKLEWYDSYFYGRRKMIDDVRVRL